jgi:adenine-specific DNA-methyltransferase
MKNLQNVTKNIIAKNKDLEILKKHFPHCFDKNGKFDFAKFKKELSKGEIDFSKEGYGMDWLGKSYARLLASDPATTLLKEDKTWNSKPENHQSQNLLLKGDNLEVLKHLSNAYHEKIRMIYIDPPYNTGTDDFVYEDDRKFTVQELAELTGIDEEKAKRILEFTQSKNNSHSAWLTFMYPRLYIAKQLLSDDGVIFISIDDNEVAQLRILMDEIFGEENFVGTFVNNSTPNARDYGHIGKMHEYCVFYAKDILRTETNLLEDKGKKFSFRDDIGEFNIHPLYNSNVAFTPENRPNLFYPFYLNPKKKVTEISEDFYEISLTQNEKYIEIYPPKSVKDRVQFVWRWGKDKAKEQLNKEIIGYKTEDGEFRIVEKMRTSEKLIRSILSQKEFTSRRGTAEVEELFNKKVFSFPKPVELIKTFLKVATIKNSIVIDFFAGSGTTGDAVMQLNAEDGGNRKYILVQLPEPIDEKKNKTAYDFVKNKLGIKNPTIFEITKERLIRAAKKIKEETINKKIAEKKAEIEKLSSQLDLEEKDEKIKQLKQEIQALESQDLGFKIFEAMPIWEGYDFKEKEFDSQAKLFDESKLTSDDLQSLLTTWKTYDGMALTDDLETVDLDSYTGYYGNGKLYLVDKGFESKHLKALLNKIDEDKNFSPASIIVFGYHFESKALREVAENVANYANKKKLEIDFITRY